MENIKIQLTTKEHFKKYSDFKKGIPKKILLNLVSSLYTNKEELQNLYNQDVHLNNIDMEQIDNKFKEVMYTIKDKIRSFKDGKTYLTLSLSESCSFIKHVLIYDVLEVKPFFQEDILNYDNLYLKWYGLPDNKKYPKTKKGYGLDLWFIENFDKWILKGVERGIKEK